LAKSGVNLYFFHHAPMKKLALSWLTLVFKAWSKGRGLRLRRAAVTMLFLTTAAGYGAPVTWDGGGDNLNWFDPLNWDTSTVPLAADDAIFGTLAPPSGVVHLGQERTVNAASFTANGYAIGAYGTNLGLTNTTGNINIAAGVFAQLNARLRGAAGLNLSGGGSLYLTSPLSDFSGNINVDGAGTTLVHRQEGLGPQYNAVGSSQEFGRFDQLTLGFSTAVRNINLTNGGTYRILGAGNNSEGNYKNIIIGAGGGTLDLAPAWLVQNLDDVGQITATTNAFTKAGNGRLIITGTMANANPLGGVVNVNDGMLSMDSQASQAVGANTYVRFTGIAGTGTTLNVNNGGTFMANNGTVAALDVPAINLNDGSIFNLNGQDHAVGFATATAAGPTVVTVSGTSTWLIRDLFGPQTQRFTRMRAELDGTGTLELRGNTNAGGTPRLVIERSTPGSDFSGTFRLVENTSLELNPRFNTSAAGGTGTVVDTGKLMAGGDVEFAGWGSTLDLRDSNPAAASVLDYTTNEITFTATQAGGINAISPVRGTAATGAGHLFNFGTLTMGSHRLAIAGNNSYQTGFADTAGIRGDAVLIMNSDNSFAVFNNAAAMTEDAAGRSLTILKSGVATSGARDVISGGAIGLSNVNVATGTLQLRGADGAIGAGFGGAAPAITVNGTGLIGNGSNLPSAGLLHLDNNAGHVVGTTTVFAAGNQTGNDRITNSATLNLRGNSTLRMTSLNNAQSTETIGRTNIFGHGTVDIVKTGTATAPVAFTLSTLSMGANATANFTGTNLGAAGTNTSRIVIPGTATGFMGAQFHQGNEWAKYDATADNGFDVGVTPFVAADYTIGSAEATWAAGQQIKQNGATLPTLTADRTADRFNFQASAANQPLNLSGFKLTADQGGIIASANTIGFKDGAAGAAPSGTAGVTAGSTAAPASLYVHSNSTVEFHAPVTDNAAGGAVTFVKSGTGTTILSHQVRTVGQAGIAAAPSTAATWSSTNTGGWVINDGMLNVHRGQYLGATPTTVTMNGGQFEINEPVSTANDATILPDTWRHNFIINGNAMIGSDDNGESADAQTGDRTMARLGSLTINNGSLLGLASFSDNDIAFMGGATFNGKANLNIGSAGRSGVNNANIISGPVTGSGFDVLALGGNGTTLVLGGTQSDATHNTYDGQVTLYSATTRLNKANGFTALTDGAASEDIIINGGNLFWGPGQHGDLATTNEAGRTAAFGSAGNIAGTNNYGLLGIAPTSPAAIMAAGQHQISDTATITLLTGTLGESDRITNERFGALIMKNGTLNVGLGTMEIGTATFSGGALGFDRGGTLRLGAASYLPGAFDQSVFTGRPGSPGAYTTLEIGAGGISLTGQNITLGNGFSANVAGAGGRLILGGDLTFNGSDLIGGSYGRKGIFVQTGSTFRELGASHIDLNGGTRDFNIGDDSLYTVTPRITNGGISKSGGGALQLEPYEPNTFAGPVIVNGGVVAARGDGAFGTSAGGVTVNSGGTVKLETGWIYGDNFTVAGRGAALAGSGGTVFEAGAVVADGGTSRLTGAFTLTGDTTVAGSNFLDPSVAPGAGGAAWRIGRLNIEGPAGVTGTGTLHLSGDGDGVILGGVNTSAGGLNKDGAGSWTINRAGTYTGSTTVSAGILRITDSGALGSTAAGTTVLGGAVAISGGVSVAEPFRLNGAGRSLQSGAIVNESGVNTLTGSLTLQSNATLRSDAGSLTVSPGSSVTGIGSSLTLAGPGNGDVQAPAVLSVAAGDALIKAGTGAWSLSNPANAFTGSLRVDGGSLTVFSGYDPAQPLRMNGGNIRNLMAGGSVAGTQLLSGGGTITTGPAFNLGAISASPGATGNFTGLLSAANASVNGIIGVYATNSTPGAPEWNKTSAGNLQPLGAGDYASFPGPATAGAAPSLTDTLNTSYGYDGNGFAPPVTGAINTSTLRVPAGMKGLNANAGNIVLDNGGLQGAGGLLIQGSGGDDTFNIGGTGLLSGASPNSDLYIHAWGNTTIANPLIGAGTGSLVKAGSGDLRLFGSSSFTGSIYVNGGSLTVPGGIAVPGVLGGSVAGGNRLININGGAFGVLSDWDLNDWDGGAAGVQSYQFNIGPAGGTLRALYGSSLIINDGSATTAGADQQLQGSGDLTFSGGGRYNLTGGTPQFPRFTGNTSVEGGVLMLGHSNSLGGRHEQTLTLRPGSAVINGTGFGLGQNGLPNNIAVPNGGVDFFSLGGNRVYGGDIQLGAGTRNTIYLGERDTPNQERQLYFNGRVSGSGVTLDVMGVNNGNPFYLTSGANDLTGNINLNANAVMEVRQPGSLGINAGDVNVNLNGNNSRLFLRHWQNGDYLANVNVNANAEINSARLTGFAGGGLQILSINDLTVNGDHRLLTIGGGDTYHTRVAGTTTFNAPTNTILNVTASDLILENGITFGTPSSTLEKRGGFTAILRGPTNHTGNLVIQQGLVLLQDGGTLSGTSNIDLRGGELRVDNSAVTNPNRVNDAATVSLGGGVLRVTGNETFGTITAASGTTQIINNPINETVPNPLTLTGFTRATGAVVQFQGPDTGAGALAVGQNTFGQTRVGSRIYIPGQADTTQTIPGFIGNNNLDFIQYNGTTLDSGFALGVQDMRNPGNVNSPQNYSNDAAETAWTDATILRTSVASTTINLTASRALDAWKIENTVTTLNQGAFDLRVEGGGILAVSANPVINGTTGRLFAGAAVPTAGVAELFFGGNNALTVNSIISDNPLSGQTTAVVKTGSAATLSVSGANTYTGGTYVTAGTLNVLANTALGAASNPITLSGGTLQFNIPSASSGVALGGLGHNINVTANSNIILDNGTGAGTDNDLAFGALTINGPYTLGLRGFDSMDASFNGTHVFSGMPTLDMVQAASGGNGTGFFTLNGEISGSGFYVAGSGATNDTTSILQIGGGAGDTAANTYAGKLILLLGNSSAGSNSEDMRVELNKAPGTTAVTGDIEINGGILRNIADHQIADTGNMVINQGSYDAFGRNETFASVIQNGGNFRTSSPGTGGSTLRVTGDYTITGLDDLTGSADGVATNSNTTLTIDGTLRMSGLARGTVGGTAATMNIGGLEMTGSTITLNGAGSLLRLNGDVTTFASAHPARLGNTTAAGATVNLGGTTRMFSVADGGAGIDLSASAILTNGGVYKTGAGAMQMEGAALANNYTGDTTVSQGSMVLFKSAGVTAIPGNLFIADGNGAARVVVRNSNQIADTSAVAIDSQGTLDLQSFNTSEKVGNLSSAGGGVTLLGPSSVLEVDITASTTYAGSIHGGGAAAGGVIKGGNGMWSLTGSSEYVGDTIVNAGTLDVDGTLNGSTIRLNGSATLQGSGIVSDVVANAGTTVAPGNSPGVLTTRNVGMLTGSFTNIEIGGLNPGNGAGFHDQIITFGDISLDSTLSVSLVNSYVPNQNDKFLIWNNDLLDPVTGTFLGLPEGATFPVPETGDPLDYWQISYVENLMPGSNGNDIRLQYVPEPGTFALAAAGGLLLLNRRRRRA